MMGLAVVMLAAILDGQQYPPPGITDTDAHRALWQELTAELAGMAAAGVLPDIPGGISLDP